MRNDYVFYTCNMQHKGTFCFIVHCILSFRLIRKYFTDMETNRKFLRLSDRARKTSLECIYIIGKCKLLNIAAGWSCVGSFHEITGHCYLQSEHVKCFKIVTFRGVIAMGCFPSSAGKPREIAIDIVTSQLQILGLC